jgi:crossover junction endodeoxyribonuclease RuvC
MKILGIDPGSHLTGWAVLEEVAPGRPPVVCALGTIVPKASLPLSARLVELGREIGTIARAHAPDAVAMEESFFAKNARTALVLGHARGALMASACSFGAPLHEYPPATVKKTVGGSGNASKEGMARLLGMQLGLSELPESLDASDALAVAWTHLQKIRSPLTAQATPKSRKKGFDVDAYMAGLKAANAAASRKAPSTI